MEHGEDASRGLEVEIPHAYYDMIVTNALYQEVIKSSLEKLFRQYVRLWDNTKILLD